MSARVRDACLRPSGLCLALALALLATTGCNLVSRQSNAQRSMLESRQLSQQGITALEHDKVSEAERLLAQAVGACQTDPDARQHYAEALWRNGSRHEAIAQLSEAIRLMPDAVCLKRKMAEYQLAEGNVDEARKWIEEALDHHPEDSETWFVRGKLLERQGDLQGALANYQRSLGLIPNQTEALLEVAELYRRMNEPRRALSTLATLREAYPPGGEPAQVFYLSGLALAALGEHDAAVAQFALALERGDDSPDLLFQLALAQYQTGYAAGAEQTATALLSREPNYAGGGQLLEQIRMSRVGQTDAWIR